MLSAIDCGNHEVKIYDSLYNSITDSYCSPVKEKCSHISMHMIKMAKQYGGTECGLYAIATMGCLAFGDDPTTVVFDQSMLRSHLGECYTKKHLEPFLVIKKRRTMQKVINEHQCAHVDWQTTIYGSMMTSHALGCKYIWLIQFTITVCTQPFMFKQ